MDSLAGRRALITGASRGIGREAALVLARAGSDIVINYRSRSGEAAQTACAVRALGRSCLVAQADVSLAADVDRLAAAAGPVDILVNNAGISRPQPLDQITERDWDELLAVNLKSCFLLTQAVLPGMRARRWGRIINISSVAAQTGGVVGPHYAASKAGMLGLTHSYANLLASEGITVNAVAPALIDTEMVRANPAATPARIPVGRFGLPAEVADVVLLLASNGYITGQTINVNGGWHPS